MREILADKSNYTKKENRKIQYIVVHYTANDGDKAQGNGYYFSQPNRGASAHYFVDENEVVRSVKDKDIAWHCGAKNYMHKFCRNENSIAVEICSRKNLFGDYYFKAKSLDNASVLITELMETYNIPIENVVRHFDVTGKICPAPLIDVKKWNEFKEQIRGELMTEEQVRKIVKDEVLKILVGKSVPSTWAVKEWKEAQEEGITDGTRPTGYAKREEVAAMILRTLKK